ncbi:Asp-tRNA(Asn)/Glu-tRNA(Gln) amidotransferase subunit GatA [Candidatus Babeliales bacterium]|nr:Asp-tRNA(Asn)/Glu-tRNA(Gln) amidotransferase subunit GatA [Candidatus Babeliales bacterium]MBP9843537.1 Asp-tRNA(Asn)/Glu-tRNA(Gln) amidotransferase subunit GatA [Candidatus Babeliales bacterium]
MDSLKFATIQDIKALVDKKAISSAEVLEFYLNRFAEFDPKVKSALEIFDKDSILKKSQSQGVLAGIPGLIKDNICQEDRIASCASKILENYRATYDATVISKLKEQGALLVGRSNMDEFAMGSSTETSAYFKTCNPWDLSRVPGGSSGGSAAAVAAGLVPWALGTDTGGSVRQPAGFCNLVGLKPTYGSVSRYGLIAYASSLDQIGVFSKTVYDSALVYSVIAGKDEKDSSTLELAHKNYTQDLTGKFPAGMTIGVVENALQAPELDSQVRAAVEQVIIDLQKAGVTIKRVQLPALDYAAATYFILSRAEAASNFARFDGVRYGFRAPDISTLEQMYTKTRHDGFGREVRVRMMVGNYVLSSGHSGKYYNNAKKVQRLIRHEFNEAFADVDLLLMPSQACPAFKFGAYDDNKLQMDLQDYFTAAVNIAGVPGISIPCGFSQEGLPIGVQLIGPHLSEAKLLQVGHAYQQMTDWHMKNPIL